MTGYLDRARARAALPIRVYVSARPGNSIYIFGEWVHSAGSKRYSLRLRTAAKATREYTRLVAEMEGRS